MLYFFKYLPQRLIKQQKRTEGEGINENTDNIFKENKNRLNVFTRLFKLKNNINYAQTKYLLLSKSYQLKKIPLL